MMTCVADEKPLLANPTSSPVTVPVASVNENGIVTACAGRTIKTAAAIATGIKNLFILNPVSPQLRLTRRRASIATANGIIIRLSFCQQSDLIVQNSIQFCKKFSGFFSTKGF